MTDSDSNIDTFTSGSDSSSEDDDAKDFETCGLCRHRRRVHSVVVDGEPMRMCRTRCHDGVWESPMPVPSKGVWHVAAYKVGVTLPELRKYTTREIAHLGIYFTSSNKTDRVLFVAFDEMTHYAFPNLNVGKDGIRRLRVGSAALRSQSAWVIDPTNLWSICCDVLCRLGYYEDATEFIYRPGLKDAISLEVQIEEAVDSVLMNAAIPTVLRSLIEQYAFEPQFSDLQDKLAAEKERRKIASVNVAKLEESITQREISLLKEAENIGAGLWSAHPEPKRPSAAKKRKADAAPVPSASASASDASAPQSKHAKTSKK